MILLAILLLQAGEPHDEGHICWIRDVRREAHGLSVLFSADPRSASRQRGTNYTQFAIDPVTTHERVDVLGYHHVRAVPAALGDKLYVYGSPEDGCVITVTKRERFLGVEAQSSINLPGLVPQSRSEFIVAR